MIAGHRFCCGCGSYFLKFRSHGGWSKFCIKCIKDLKNEIGLRVPVEFVYPKRYGRKLKKAEKNEVWLKARGWK